MKKTARKNIVNFVITICSLGIFFLFLLFYPSQNILFATPVRAKPPLIKNVNFTLPTPAPYPRLIAHAKPLPKISAESFLILDANSDVVLAAKNDEEKLKIASITKLMTALTALDTYDKQQVLDVKRNFTNGAVIGLAKGEKIETESLLKALLIASANDAAQVLSDNSPSDFVNLMNEKAKKIHLANTLFSNPQGFDDGENFSTVRDLSRLASYAINNEFIRQTIRTPFAVVKNDNGEKTYELRNVNHLLFDDSRFQGIKTGYTEGAGECLLSLVKSGKHEIIIVVLKSEDRFAESAKLADWAFANFIWVKPLELPL